MSSQSDQPPKRGPGRPRKAAAAPAEPVAKRPVGRPRKVVAPAPTHAEKASQRPLEPADQKLVDAFARAFDLPSQLLNLLSSPTPRLLVVIPSKGRPGNIARAIDAWDLTGAFDIAQMVVLVEAAELEAYAQVIGPARYRPIMLVETGAPGYAHGANWAARRWISDQGLGAATDHLAVQGDDHLPETPGWAQRYVAELDQLVEQFGAGMVYGDDGLRGERLATEWAVSRSWVETIGRVIPALVGHLYSDTSVLDLAKAAGVARYLPDVWVRHLHPLAGRAEWDEQYRRVNSDRQQQDDRRIYIRWSTRPESSPKAGLVNQAAKLRALRP